MTTREFLKTLGSISMWPSVFIANENIATDFGPITDDPDLGRLTKVIKEAETRAKCKLDAFIKVSDEQKKERHDYHLLNNSKINI